MKKVKCYSVRLESLTSISEKAYKATAFDGSEAILPKSQVFGPDHDVQKSDAYWISVWILAQKDLQYSRKKTSFFDKDMNDLAKDSGITVEHHVPDKLTPEKGEINPALLKEDVAVKGYYLNWKLVRVPINRFGKLATRNRAHIETYNGPLSKCPKGFVQLNDNEYEVAKLRKGYMIEPFTTPVFEPSHSEKEKLAAQ